MRIYIRLSQNEKLIPFDYQHLLTGVVHKWIGKNNQEHGSRSLYSFSWLKNTRSENKGINFTPETYFFFSSYDAELVKKVINGILKEPTVFYGSRVVDVQIKEVPEFGFSETFILDSPVLIRKNDGEVVKHITFENKDFGILLTENLKNKLSWAGLSTEDLTIEIDESYGTPKTKLVNYKGIKNKTSLLPIVINGSPEQIAFAWTVGLGHSTGIGFGAIR